MKACPKCETLWDDGKRFCPYHGLPLTPALELAAAPPAAAPVDAELTVKMSEEEQARLFAPQLPAVESAPVSEPVPSAWAAPAIEDPPTLKSLRRAPDAAPLSPPPTELDTFIPPTVVVAPSASPPADIFIPPTVVVTPAATEAVAPSSPVDASIPSSPATVTSGASQEGLSPVTTVVSSPATSRFDPSATVVSPGPAGAVSPRLPSPPASAPNDDVGFILDLGEKSSTRLPAPTKNEPALSNPPGRNLTPSAVPSLVPPPSPTVKRLTAVQYFKLFNERKKIIQQFVQGLDPRKVKVTEEHSNQEDYLMHRYDLAFRSLGMARTFPVVIILRRKPVYDLITSVDLYEIAESPLLREERTKSLGGECKPTPNGTVYYLSYGNDLPTEQLGEWLTKTFQAITALLPGASL
ncbi:MAG: hypothetical protein NZ585_04385 [Chloracidobacterium sp.]|nr:hypothetical protein [Chloracidobacterium sp.]MDW8218592.1 hypothetical protein [Acidobacteriota bacterium]